MRLLAVLLCSSLFTSVTAAAADLPQWARAVVGAANAPAKASAVVLIDHVDVAIAADGKMITRRRYAARILDRSGRSAAAVRSVYLTGGGTVKGLRGWLVRRGADVQELGGRDTIDAALVNNDVYNEVRVRILSAADQVSVGDVFVAEAETEEKLLFAQIEWSMQTEWPMLLVRRTLTLPHGWRANAVVFNRPRFEPTRDGAATTWELRDVPALPDEAAMPPETDLATRLAVSVFAPPPARAPGQFESWSEVSSWLSAISDGSAAVTDRIAAKSRELTAAATTDAARVAAIARHAQRVQYISIQTGIGRGGGYQPRQASTVLERNYGDCKDKASLMRALLAAAGIKSYLVTLFAGDRKYVRPEWPSPQQFNHAIIAVSVTAGPDASTSTIEHPTLGQLVLFDPTDQYTPFGELPLHEQGSLALIVTAAGSDLVRVPVAPAAHHSVTRMVEGSLSVQGVLTASIREQYAGASAADVRGRRASLDAAMYQEWIERRLSRAIPRARLRSVETLEDSSGGLTLTVDIEAVGHGQSTGTTLFVAPPFDLRSVPEMPTANARQTGVAIEPRLISESVRLELPAGYVLDEKPAPLSLETAFGRYTVSYAIEKSVLVARRSLELPLQIVAPERLPAARAFFDQVRAADTALVALARR